jgi:putative exosortase-associated protein (TIGR04073 family)
MRLVITIITLMLIACLSYPSFAQDEKKPETIVGKMSVKLVRGVTNVATSIVELPKQTYLTVRDEGAVGYVVGPLKGIGMTVYRAFIGAVETAFFPVPAPGYYDPMIDPAYVWEGWECKWKQAPGGSESPRNAPPQKQKE